MRWLSLGLLALVLLLQYRLWLAEGGLAEASRLEARVARERAINAELAERNELLERQVLELQSGNKEMEALAREDLGLVREGEVYYQFAEKPKPDEDR